MRFETAANQCEADRLTIDFGNETFEPSIGTEAVAHETRDIEVRGWIFHRGRQLGRHRDYNLGIRG